MVRPGLLRPCNVDGFELDDILMETLRNVHVTTEPDTQTTAWKIAMLFMLPNQTSELQ